MSKERIILTWKDVVEGKADQYIGKPGRFSDIIKFVAQGGGVAGVLHSCDPEAIGPFIRRIDKEHHQFFSPDTEPEDKYVPFTFEDGPLFRDRWLKPSETVQTDRDRMVVTQYDLDGVTLNLDKEVKGFSYESMLSVFVFEDGTPFGKKV